MEQATPARSAKYDSKLLCLAPTPPTSLVIALNSYDVYF